jgi:GT2 family glycosyltransferase
VIDLPASVIYHHDPSNPGVAGAYNRAAEIAACNGSQWLITLDQDTRVPEDYLIRMAAAAQRSIGYAGVGAVVPQIAAGRKLLSPHHLAFGALPRWFPSGFQGIPSEPVFAFNSGAMIRIDALEQIGGYDTQFSLEYSDTAMFRKLHQYGKRVGISGDIQLRHEFSLIEMNRLLSAERYRRTLAAESAFWDLHMNWLAGCERTMRLLLRSVRQRLRKDRADLRRVTLEFLALRLFHSRRFRLARWRAAVAGEASHIATMEQRPRVSVCMAAYNGGRFIQEQLDSIFPQLAADDEVVIVDDCSTDDTIARIQNCRDERIRLLVHEKNQGVVATFEDTLRSAHGDILFLCDDDDLWAPGKVERVLREFEAHPDVHIVTTRAVLIDDRGARLPNARVNRYGEFLSGFWRNILMNHYQGSAMAIRASLLGRVLPFPRHKLFLHDVWIGTRNDAAGGKTSFIDEPLLYYRRHAKNSSLVHRPLRKVRVRLELLWAHLSRTASISSD